MRDGSVVERDLVLEETKIGKGPHNDIILADASVSGAHALISFAEGVYTLSDLGSRNGTSLNDQRLTSPQSLQHGDLIKMGHCTITFRMKEAGDTLSIQISEIINPAQPPPPPTPPPPPKLVEVSEESLAAALVSAGLVAQSKIDRWRGPDARGRRLCRALLEENLITEIGLRDLMSRTFNIPPIELKTMEIDAATASTLGSQFLHERLVSPVVGQAADRLLIAIADPTDKTTINEIERVTHKKPSLRVAKPSEILAHLDGHFLPRLIGITPAGEKIEALINHDEIEIGKATHNRLVIPDRTVSSTHAIVLVYNGGYSIADLGSSNGTYVNGRRLTREAHTLQHGDKIQLGQVLLTFRNPAETTENKTARLSLEALQEIRKRAAQRVPANLSNTDPTPELAHALAGIMPVAAPLIAAPPVSTEPVEEKNEKVEKKKKKKDKKGWFSANALSRILAQVLGALVTLAGSYYVVKKGLNPDPPAAGNQSVKNSPESKLAPPGAFSSIRGGFIEASGVAWINGTNEVMVVSDSQPGQVLLMQLDQNGQQVGSLTALELGVSAKDPEGITYGGGYFYVIGSQSDPKDGQKNALLRFAFDPASRQIRGEAQAITDLRGFLLKAVPELKGIGERPGNEDGLNIEGICWDPANERLLLGLRSPLINGLALVVALKFKDPLGPFTTDNLQPADPRLIRLNLGGQGIRDLNYNPQLKTFLILSGATESSSKTAFGLWEWNGNLTPASTEASPRQEQVLDERAKPEGITHVTIESRSFVFIVGDSSKYLKLDYSDAN
ncbi:MAG TPA: DUF3616 domain-containing protein [Blastocatellia bacterium]|nr:DUF3616 domain-containing protein [Blastocatellia bacterium]